MKKRRKELIGKNDELPIRNRFLEQRFWERENRVIT